ncbi:MAG: histidine phosphatase family protein [Oscillospiraceae bacterium]|nr:histidine phosphatase family protein [Oscillospiraceae bacterium]MDE6776811.1 histidine phosphatase family protein [Oscillospiraceae bacterium]MDE7093692.1 histidine phosphatase family protein [Oscillospiraceae bacterium]
MKGYHLSFYRHGKTKANEDGIYIGSTDFPLSDKGAVELSGKMDLYEYPRVQRVYSSPLLRCTETAEILFPEVPLYLIEDLRELNFGKFEGKSALELIGQEDYRTWLKGGSPDMRPPEGESVEELCIRSYRAVYRILMDMMEQDFTHCAVITHAGVISNLLACFGLPKISPKELHCEAGEGFEVLLTAQMWQTAQAFEILGMTPYSRN